MQRRKSIVSHVGAAQNAIMSMNQEKSSAEEAIASFMELT